MEKEVMIKFIIVILIIIISIIVLILYLRKNNDEIDYDKYIKLMKDQTKTNLSILDRGNKEINRLQKKISKCKEVLCKKSF